MHRDAVRRDGSRGRGPHCIVPPAEIAWAATKDGHPSDPANGLNLLHFQPTEERPAMPYNILILGAAYGSLLASKMLFGGHKIHHVCLPAEADLINAEGFRVRMPVKGRKDPVLL